jgi:hypothetical protein
MALQELLGYQPSAFGINRYSQNPVKNDWLGVLNPFDTAALSGDAAAANCGGFSPEVQNACGWAGATVGFVGGDLALEAPAAAIKTVGRIIFGVGDIFMGK